jgi:4-alpha-glucanotransferase
LMSADQWGVSYGYFDTDGEYHETPAEIRRIIRLALGAPEDETVGPPDNGAIVTSQSDQWTTRSPATITLESGESRLVESGWAKPHDFPFGYHQIQFDGQSSRAFIAAPDSCFMPEDFSGWGWAIQLYAMRSNESWGFGDLHDLRTLNSWSAANGASYTLINPLHAPTPTEGQEPSPYFPTSRIWRNPLYLRIEDIPGWNVTATDLASLASQSRSLNNEPLINREKVRALKLPALIILWTNWKSTHTPAHAEFEKWRSETGTGVEQFGLYCALVDLHGGDTRTWPVELANGGAVGVKSAATQLTDQVSFHVWTQWLIEMQLASANSALPVMTDLAIGVDRAGADAWMWPDAFGRTMSVGAPPDTFNTQGQNWGLPPFDPWKLRDENYAPFIQTVRAAMKHSGALRMDHILGLFRLWWIPEGNNPIDGCYVYLPYRDLTAIVALESHRAQVGVVGEDLGTVEPYVSVELQARNILSYKLVQFESVPTAQLTPHSMVAITTHDLPTIAGMWTGTDLIDCVLAEVVPNVEGTAGVRVSFGERANFVGPFGEMLEPLPEHDRRLLLDAIPRGSLDATAAANNLSRIDLEARLGSMRGALSSARIADAPDFLEGMLRDLATSTSRLVAATLDDALYVTERPNLPGTTTQRPNWQYGLPMPLNEILDQPGVATTAAILGDRQPRNNRLPQQEQP